MEQVVAVATERRLAHLTLAEDPFFPRIREGVAGEAVDFALAAGQAAADMAGSGWGRDPEKVAESLEVPVTRDTERIRAGAEDAARLSAMHAARHSFAHRGEWFKAAGEDPAEQDSRRVDVGGAASPGPDSSTGVATGTSPAARPLSG
jgi:hypothetical protein